ncbi:MAG TPA: SGNH/GDSL hydrolase family protein [Candidatus Gallibacteroides avistercoris]|uniref:SGNH/GDSL hydrolase family protein n=1 Tax=Candidatus Gallibacteroides avistercoris TaxID=2840833 RepID=A0A9D1M5Q8_9BACT|nr:SGNH/GDSL hydrolase family protein [Candidatus Gallibacteroides avistercoris]
MKHTILLLLILPFFIGGISAEAKEPRNVNIVFIGNSITEGAQIANPAQDAPPKQVQLYLSKKKGIGTVQFVNCGVSGSTTLDFLPGSGALFKRTVNNKTVKEFRKDKETPLYFSIMLGTNDSAIKGPNGSPVSAEAYKANLKKIIDKLLSDFPGCRIVLHRPIWYSETTYNGAMYLAEGLNRLQTYTPQIEAIVKEYKKTSPNRVFLGDTKAFQFFKENYLTHFVAEEGYAGTFYLHPNEQGAKKLAEYWGEALYKIIMK